LHKWKRVFTIKRIMRIWKVPGVSIIILFVVCLTPILLFYIISTIYFHTIQLIILRHAKYFLAISQHEKALGQRTFTRFSKCKQIIKTFILIPDFSITISIPFFHHWIWILDIFSGKTFDMRKIRKIENRIFFNSCKNIFLLS
jgi:hypothetical protein